MRRCFNTQAGRERSGEGGVCGPRESGLILRVKECQPSEERSAEASVILLALARLTF